MTRTPAAGVRARARVEMIAEIKRIAREHLAADGPDLSLRAVARDLGVVSSAVYRYFDSRDALLTALIVDAYDSMGEAAEAGEAAVPRHDLMGRWLALGRAIRAWSIARPHEYALLYGSPVPGYAAPQDTIGPAFRPVVVLASILRDGVDRGVVTASDRLPKVVRSDIAGMRELFGDTPAPVVMRGLTAWAQLFGALSFELFGRLQGGISDYEALFDHQLKAMGAYLGLA